MLLPYLSFFRKAVAARAASSVGRSVVVDLVVVDVV
jgi:hypothetical protein